MININGTLVDDSKATIHIANRGYTYGDALFETIRVNSEAILFWEDHYFRLMASMRILRMEIPLHFTMEFLQEEILKIIRQNNLSNSSARIKIIVNRKQGGLYTPDHNSVDYSISAIAIPAQFYTISESEPYEITLFKDHYAATDLLSTLKSTNKLIHVLGGIFAKENGFANAILLNANKNVIECLNGNLFLVRGNTIKTPPISDGCLKGVLRTQLLRILNKLDDYEVIEASISPFELQKADELFITNVITGIQPITKFRKKNYKAVISKKLVGVLNAAIRLEN